MPKVDAWRQLREEILLNLDVRAAFESWGLKFTGKVSSSNWAECRAFGREDKSPSAAVNLTTGVYKDFAGDRASIFDFMVAHNIAPSWQEAQEELAKKCGLAKKIPKKAKAKRTQDVLGFTNTFNLASVVPLARQYGIDPQVIAMMGARMARYPASSQEPQIVCAFPIYSPISMLDSPTDSYVLQSGSGQPIMVYQGPDVPAKPEKRIVVGTTGILNKFALENWATAERIYKVEGLSDMLVLQNFIPDEYRTKHLVITNACGCDDGAPAWELANHCVGKEVIIIHDADVPGQFGNGKDQSGGAQRWVKALKATAKVLKNVQLPYEIQSKHGKDLRNWIAEEGRKYSDLLELVAKTKDDANGNIENAASAATERTLAQVILDRLELVVLGHDPDRSTKIHMMNLRLRRRFEIPDISKYAFTAMLVDLGSVARSEIDDGPDPSPAKVSVKQLKDAIAETASERRLSRGTAAGTGCWEMGGELVLVGSGDWAKVREGKLERCSLPSVPVAGGSRLVNFGDVDFPWYDQQSVEGYLSAARDPLWRTGVFNEMAEIFQRWDNWDLPQAPQLLTGLAFSSWVQDIWSWRPWIALHGKSNCGKSTLLKFLGRYFGDQMTLHSDNATEAGLRQSLGMTSKVLLLDELEQCRERDRILQWLKSSGGGGRSVRGTPGQQSVISQVRVIPWMAATEFDLNSETTRNRYIMFRMKSRLGKRPFRFPDFGTCEDLRSRSIAIVLTIWKEAIRLHQVMVDNISLPDVDTRYIESYALPVAMQAAVMGLDEVKASQILEEILDSALEEITGRNIPEHEVILSEILMAQIPTFVGQARTVSELLSDPSCDQDLLPRFGLKKYFSSNDKIYFLFVGKAVKQVLRGTSFQGRDVIQSLIRIEGAKNDRQRLSRQQQWGASIPWNVVERLLGRESEDEDFVPAEQRSQSISSEVFNTDGG